MEKVIEKFIRYAKIDTKADPDSDSCPSTMKQWELLRLLAHEVQDLGLEASLDENGYLFARLPANSEKTIKKLGFLAHVDTSPDFSAEGVKPMVTLYTGGDLVLNAEQGIVMKREDFPALDNYIGQELIHTDGNTLLGADDKAGIAEIMTVIEYLTNHPEIEHGEILFAFTPDEEVGRGPARFDVERFGAEVAYTIDGGPLGELEYENFNAAHAKVNFRGRNVHPGTAKNKMINSIKIAMEFADVLPKDEVPEKTEGYEGFFHLTDIKGEVEQTELQYIIRDHDAEYFSKRKQLLMDMTEDFNQEYGQGTVELILRDQYQNMKEKIEPVMYLIDLAKQAMLDCGVEPVIKPIRGGTDGAQLSFKGLPCPNIFTGGENYHGRFEFISKASMIKACAVVLRLIELFVQYENKALS